MTAKFTPGPWKLNGECFTAGGHYDAPRVFSHADPDNPRFIAEIAVGNLWEENGNLTAAAPEMYGFIKREFDETLCICKFKEWTSVICTHCQAGAILAKADGVQP